MRKTTYYNYKKLFSFRKPTIISRSNALVSSFDEEQNKTKLFFEEAILKKYKFALKI